MPNPSAALQPLVAARKARVADPQTRARREAKRRGHQLHDEWFYPRAVWLPLSVTFCVRCHMCVVADDGVEQALSLRGGAVKLRCPGVEKDE